MPAGSGRFRIWNRRQALISSICPWTFAETQTWATPSWISVTGRQSAKLSRWNRIMICYDTYMVGFHKWWYPNSWMVYVREHLFFRWMIQETCIYIYTVKFVNQLVNQGQKKMEQTKGETCHAHTCPSFVVLSCDHLGRSLMFDCSSNDGGFCSDQQQKSCAWTSGSVKEMSCG